MRVYLLYGDTYDDSWGSEISAFGVYSTLEKAEEAKEKVRKEYKMTGNYDPFDIIELNLDEYSSYYLGGYYE